MLLGDDGRRHHARRVFREMNFKPKRARNATCAVFFSSRALSQSLSFPPGSTYPCLLLPTPHLEPLMNDLYTLNFTQLPLCLTLKYKHPGCIVVGGTWMLLPWQLRRGGGTVHSTKDLNLFKGKILAYILFKVSCDTSRSPLMSCFVVIPHLRQIVGQLTGLFSQ